MTDANEIGENASAAEDDWAAAMAEQAIADAAPAANAQPAQIFQAFGETDGKASMMNELDMILDIPVQMAVEVVVVNDKFGIRLTDIITPSERMRKDGR